MLTQIVIIAAAFSIFGAIVLGLLFRKHALLSSLFCLGFVLLSLHVFELETQLKGRPIESGLPPHTKFILLSYKTKNNHIYLWLLKMSKVPNEVTEPMTYVIPYNKDSDKNLEDSMDRQNKSHIPEIIDTDNHGGSLSPDRENNQGQQFDPNATNNPSAGGYGVLRQLFDEDKNALITPRPFNPGEDAPKQTE
jgi:hypothetical protein